MLYYCYHLLTNFSSRFRDQRHAKNKKAVECIKKIFRPPYQPSRFKTLEDISNSSEDKEKTARHLGDIARTVWPSRKNQGTHVITEEEYAWLRAQV